MMARGSSLRQRGCGGRFCQLLHPISHVENEDRIAGGSASNPVAVLLRFRTRQQDGSLPSLDRLNVLQCGRTIGTECLFVMFADDWAISRQRLALPIVCSHLLTLRMSDLSLMLPCDR